MPLVSPTDWSSIGDSYRIDIASRAKPLYHCDGFTNICPRGTSYWQYFLPRDQGDCMRPICHKIEDKPVLDPAIDNPHRIHLVPFHPHISKSGFI